MSKITVVEMCPHCGCEIEMKWELEQFGLHAYCPVCGSQMMLCDECIHNDKFKTHCGDADGNGNCLHYCEGRKRRYNYLSNGGPAYDVEITEVLRKVVTVNGATPEEAELNAACKYKDGDFILDENDLKTKEIVAVRRSEIPAEQEKKNG